MELFSSDSKVVKLTADNFRQKVLASGEVWLVEFYAPWCGHCKNLAPEWEKAAKALEGIVNIGAVDMTTDQQAGSSYGIRGYPTIKVFGADKNSPTDYSGARTAASIVEQALAEAKKVALSRLNGGQQQQQQQSSSGSGSASTGPEATITLTDADFANKVYNSEKVWLVEFYAPWCGHCKKLQPEWEAAAKKTKGAVNLAKVDCTVHQSTCQQFGIKGYPTIKFFPPQSKSQSDAQDYRAGREEAQITKYAMDLFTKYGGDLELKQITSQETFKKDCLDSDQNACFIFFLPHILDSSEKERVATLNMIKDVMKEYLSYPMVFLWSQAGDQFDFESQFPLGAGYPALLTIIPKKNKYSVMRTGQGFEVANIKAYINSLLAGKETAGDLPAQLNDIKKADAWKQSK